MRPQFLKAAVLISGQGSNFKALIDAVASAKVGLDIVLLVSNREDAAGIRHAKAADIPVTVISHRDYADRQAHDAAISAVLLKSQTQLVVLAGYMRILGDAFTRVFDGRVINLHPSLLPLHKGLDTYNRALNAGDKETGASIHYVTAGLDSGPVIAQVRMPILKQDNASSLAFRLGPLEHKLLVSTVALLCKHRIRLKSGSVYLDDQPLDQPLQMDHDGIFIQGASA